MALLKIYEPSELLEGSVGELRAVRVLFNPEIPKLAFLKVELADGTEHSYHFPTSIIDEIFGQGLSDVMATKAYICFLEVKARAEQKSN